MQVYGNIHILGDNPFPPAQNTVSFETTADCYNNYAGKGTGPNASDLIDEDLNVYLNTTEQAKLELGAFFVKDDGRNPTASFKDRASAIVVARAREIQAEVVITASTGNAGAALRVIDEHGSLAAYLASQVPPPPRRLPPDATPGSLPATTPDSDRLSKDLARRGFRFVGSTIVYAFMQSVGLVDDHVPGCFRYRG